MPLQLVSLAHLLVPMLLGSSSTLYGGIPVTKWQRRRAVQVVLSLSSATTTVHVLLQKGISHKEERVDQQQRGPSPPSRLPTAQRGWHARMYVQVTAAEGEGTMLARVRREAPLLSSHFCGKKQRHKMKNNYRKSHYNKPKLPYAE